MFFLFLPMTVLAIAYHPILGKFPVFYTIRNPVNRAINTCRVFRYNQASVFFPCLPGLN